MVQAEISAVQAISSGNSVVGDIALGNRVRMNRLWVLFP